MRPDRAALANLIAALTLRRAGARQLGRGARRRWPRLLRFGPALDFNPVLWRDWRRRVGSLWLRAVWVVYALLSVAASLIALMAYGGPPGSASMPAFVNAFQFSIGLLLAGVTAVATLFEERVRGSLDMLLVTPLPTASIVWGKWWANARLVASVSLLPLLVGIGTAARGAASERAGNLVLLLALLVAYGGFVNSLGLVLAIWIQRFGVALGVMVTLYVLIAAGPVLLLLTERSDRWHGFAYLSPWYGIGEMTFRLGSAVGGNPTLAWRLLWLLVYTAGALLLAALARRTFDRCVGRVPESRPGH